MWDHFNTEEKCLLCHNFIEFFAEPLSFEFQEVSDGSLKISSAFLLLSLSASTSWLSTCVRPRA